MSTHNIVIYKEISTIIPNYHKIRTLSVLLWFQVTDIWYTHLYGIVKVRTRTPATPKGVGPLIVERSDEIEDSLGMNNYVMIPNFLSKTGQSFEDGLYMYHSALLKLFI